MADRQLKVTLVGDTRNLDRALGKTETRLQKFGRSAGGTKGGKIGGLLSGGGLGAVGKAGFIGAAVAAGTAVTVKALSSLVRAAEEAQVAQAGLKQAFAAAGKSQEKYGKQVDATIQSVSKLAGIDDEEVSRNFANLLRTTGSVAKATRDIALAANIARARHISLAAATKVVEKAENGQLRGLKSLGVQIDKNTTSTEAIDRAQRKFAGSAEAYGKTAAGAQDRLGVAFENVREKLGVKLLPIVTKLSLKLIDFIDWSEKNWPRFAKAVSDAYHTAKPIIDTTIGQIKGLANAIEGMIKIVHGLFTGDWKEAWKGFKQYAIDGIGGVIKATAELPLKIAKSLANTAFDGLEKAFTAALNRIIKLINKAIGIYNKIPLLPNVDKVPTLGGSTTGAKTGGAVSSAPVKQAPVVRSERQLSSVTINVNGSTTPEETARAVAKELQRVNRHGSPQGGGRAPGAWTGLH